MSRMIVTMEGPANAEVLAGVADALRMTFDMETLREAKPVPPEGGWGLEVPWADVGKVREFLDNLEGPRDGVTVEWRSDRCGAPTTSSAGGWAGGTASWSSSTAPAPPSPGPRRYRSSRTPAR